MSGPPRAIAIALFALAASVALSAEAVADDDWRFRRTTPRAELSGTGPLELGVPRDRAWGIESRLRPLGPSGLALELAVRDPSVREAFVRVAWYDRASGRPRQIDLDDTAYVRDGQDRVLSVPLTAPAGAVAYRVRVLARLESGELRSAGDAIGIRWVDAGLARPGLTRLVDRLMDEAP